MSIQFYKFQGTGNDFVIIDDRQLQFPTNTEIIARICNRRFGLGADGLILLQPPKGQGQFYMQYFNSDGHESSMCGNGGRCISAFYALLHPGTEHVVFSAIDGMHQARVSKQSVNQYQVELQMSDVHAITFDTDDKEALVLNTGSPHFVKFAPELLNNSSINEPAQAVRYNETYKHQGINVNFVAHKSKNHIHIRTYERGVEDETLSCGTGATAAALATAYKSKFIKGKHQIQVDVQGGTLRIDFQYHPETSLFTDIWLCGPATLVYTGVIELTFF
jgi:diaminopimelate epimerase